MLKGSKLIVWFNSVDKEDIALVGGKGANLGEMTKNGFPVPEGFIVTSFAYFNFLKENNLTTKIKHLLAAINFDDQDSINKASKSVKNEIVSSRMSDILIKEIFKSYRRLGGVFKEALVAVRSSATAEDLPKASFAGQQETFLNVKGEANLLIKIKEAWASLFTSRAIYYRHQQKFDHFRIGIAVPVQKMVESEKSGVMFTIDPVTNDKNKIVIEAIYGLGELIVQGEVTPDHYEVLKNGLTIFKKNISVQKLSLKKVGTNTKKVKVRKSLSERQKISDQEIISLANLGSLLEKHYYFPQDIEWAIFKNKIYIVQTRPVTTIHSLNAKTKLVTYKNEGQPKVLLRGDPASPGIATGPVRIISNAGQINKILRGEVLVAPQTNPDFVAGMKKAVAIVTDKGGRTSHAAIVSRELGIPAVVGTGNATKILKTGNIVSVNGLKGEIYKGSYLPASSSSSIPLNPIYVQTATKVYVNLAQPDLAKSISEKYADGVGLLRAEFIMAQIGTHPKSFIKNGKKDIFIKELAKNLEEFCKSFNPRPVVYRTSDFKTNEYRNLIGGKAFEPIESNPMLGYRGAFRYLNDPEIFNLELEAIKLVRNKSGFKNLWIMLPFVRTVSELLEVKKLISASGLYRSSNFKIWMMVEIPSNVILLEKFIYAGIDGVSIGSNDLTMLILGTDRDNSEVASVFDEQNEAVLWAIENVIKTCNKYKITSSICGQAPSMYPSLLKKLVKWGITSVSVSPDAIDNTRKLISEFEENLFDK